jgi:hypothetical protein
MRRLLMILVLLVIQSGTAQAEPQWLTLPPTPNLPKAAQSGYAPLGGIRIW